MTGREIFKFIKIPLLLIVWFFRLIPNFFLSFFWSLLLPFNGFISKSLRYCILKAKAKDIGDNVLIGSNTYIKKWNNFSCGANVSIHENCYIDCDGGVKIGDNVSIAHATSMVSANHTWDDQNLPIKYNPLVKKGIIIEDDVWRGCGVRVLDDVIIRKRTVVAAGAVVTKSFESNVLIGGIPAKQLKKI